MAAPNDTQDQDKKRIQSANDWQHYYPLFTWLNIGLKMSGMVSHSDLFQYKKCSVGAFIKISELHI